MDLLISYAINHSPELRRQIEAAKNYGLKDAMLFATWPADAVRPTGDLDLIGQGDRRQHWPEEPEFGETGPLRFWLRCQERLRLSGVESGLIDGFTNLGPGRPHTEGIFVGFGQPPIEVVAHSFQELTEGPRLFVSQGERN